MKIIKALGIILILEMCGCTTSFQLEDNTLHQGKSLTDLEYEMVLDNIAMFKVSTDALPWHAIVAKAAITINDIVTPAASYKGGPPVRTLSLGASRAWQGDWTITPVVDPVVLEKLRHIYKRRSAESWFQSGLPVPKFAEYSGHYGSKFIWVNKSGMQGLVDTTMEVLEAASSVTTPAIALTKSGVFDFSKRLNDSTNIANTDFTSQFLLAQLPPATKSLLAAYETPARSNDIQNIYWISNVLQSGLNKTVASWTTNEVYQLAASIQMSDSTKLNSDLKVVLTNSIQTNTLLQTVLSQITNYYPGDFEPKQVTNSASSLYPYLTPGGPSLIQ